MPARKKVVKKTAKKKATAKKAPVRKATVAKTPAKKTVAKKTPTRKAPAKKTRTAKAPAKKAVAKKTPAKKAPAKKAATKKTPAKKTSPRKAPAKKSTSSAYGEFSPYRQRKGEEYMSAEQLDHFRSILFGWRKELMEEVDRTVHHMQDDASNYADPSDRATQEEEFALELRTRDRERKLIIKIDDALSDLESGDYGYCEACGIEIGIQRLEVRPTATLCIDCKTLDEIREKQGL